MLTPFYAQEVLNGLCMICDTVCSQELNDLMSIDGPFLTCFRSTIKFFKASQQQRFVILVVWNEDGESKKKRNHAKSQPALKWTLLLHNFETLTKQTNWLCFFYFFKICVVPCFICVLLRRAIQADLGKLAEYPEQVMVINMWPGSKTSLRSQGWMRCMGTVSSDFKPAITLRIIKPS